jgi:adenosine deaminase
MVTKNIIRQLLSDKNSLSEYANGEMVNFEDVKMRLTMLERQENRHIPDHYYRMNCERCFQGIDSLPKLLQCGLFNLSAEYLELVSQSIYVKQYRQNEWQELLSYIPPLILQMAFLANKRPVQYINTNEIRSYFNEYIVPNVRYTALSYPLIPDLEKFVESRHGLQDLHIHLNGSTEFDVFWQYIIKNSSEVCSSYASARYRKKQSVFEQWEAETNWDQNLTLESLLMQAKNIRFILWNILYSNNICNQPNNWGQNDGDIMNFKSIFQQVRDEKTGSIDSDHPFAQLVYTSSPKPELSLPIEGLMYVLVLNYLSIQPRKSVAALFHYYLLIQGLMNRLVVQQVHQNGFAQFQKITHNDLRRGVEKSYISRFFQLDGNRGFNIRFLEGRFSPTDKFKNNLILINTIEKDWDKFCSERVSESLEGPELRLIAHFIKSKDNNNNNNIRHYDLRKKIQNQAVVLNLLKKNSRSYLQSVVGVDAASSELDANPEVFAPSYQYLRHNGWLHFTYHAGEDFYHLLGGMRAIYEAVDFCELREGDRIGHACAAGLAPQNWLADVGERLFVRQGEYMDDLVFTYCLIMDYLDDKDTAALSLCNKIQPIINRISELFYAIYKIVFPITVITRAWKIRKYNPILLHANSLQDARCSPLFDMEEWNVIQKDIGSHSNQDDVRKCNLYYHDSKYLHAYNKSIEIDTVEFFDDKDYETIQLLLLKYLHSKGIVLESLPTSNIRIGHYDNYDSYHLWRWFQWKRNGQLIPPIVLGSDDAGIFATNIYNEYANVYCNLVYKQKVNRDDAMSLIEELDHNSYIYRFERC